MSEDKRAVIAAALTDVSDEYLGALLMLVRGLTRPRPRVRRGDRIVGRKNEKWMGPILLAKDGSTKINFACPGALTSKSDLQTFVEALAYAVGLKAVPVNDYREAFDIV